MSAPPPYNDITGLYLQTDKHVDVSFAQYDGSARPGELVVNTADYSVWVGDDTGALNPIAVPNGVVPFVVNNPVVNYQLVTTDLGKLITASNITITVPSTVQAGFAAGSYLTIATGVDLVIVQPSGVTVSVYYSGNTTAGSWIIPPRSIARLTKVAAEVWYLDGAGIVSF